MPTHKMDAKALFNQALAIAAPEERQAWLERTCADQPDLRRKVGVLLKAHDDAGSFLQKPPGARETGVKSQKPVTRENQSRRGDSQ